jgi:hypothetical protein
MSMAVTSVDLAMPWNRHLEDTAPPYLVVRALAIESPIDALHPSPDGDPPDQFVALHRR